MTFKRIRSFIWFLSLLIIILGLAFLLHTFVLDHYGKPKYADRIVASYLVNGGLAAIIYGVLYLFQRNLKNYLGFLYMIGSFLKFIVFFLLFYPVYKADGEMRRLEFAAFFVPYVISLILETVFAARMLQKLER